MLLLAIETARYAEASIALLEEGRTIAERRWPLGRQVSAELVPAIGEMVGERVPDAMVADRGPGSFTGLRTGLAAAQGLALGWNIPLYGLSCCQFFPRLTAEEDELLLLDARAGGGFYFEFRPAGAPPQMGYAPAAEIAARFPSVRLCYGDYSEALALPAAAAWRETEPDLSAAGLGRLALPRIAAGEALPPEAIYLHCRIVLPKK